MWVEVSGRRIADQGDLVFTMRNISRRKAVEAELEAANGRLLRLAITDELTGLNNRRELNRLVDIEANRSMEAEKPLSVMLIDVDHFKAYNDTYGHLEGDRCLKEIATAISASIRHPVDACARYGGEEFAILLPDTGEESARMRAEIVRQAVAALNLRHSGSKWGHVTVSIGVATCREDLEMSRIFKMADDALYAAKGRGRNRVVASSHNPNTASLDDARTVA